ncbi:MAG: acyl-CoA thioesterase [Planctomycetota bacterium]
MAKQDKEQGTEGAQCGTKGELALRTTLLPKDTNPAGTIFGGVILSLIDQAGEIAMRRINPHRRYVTVAMDSIKFLAPVFVGDLISLYTCSPQVGRTSVSVQVDVIVERRDRPGEEVTVTVAHVTYVAIGGDGKPIPVAG